MFRLEFETHHPMFKDFGRKIAVKRILDKVAYAIAHGKEEGVIEDLDGIKIGEFALTPD